VLKRLGLTSFTGFDQADITWSPGLNVVVGENGTGKSQLLKLAYTLAWVSAAMGRSTRQSKDEWQRRLADKLVATCRPEYLGRLVSRQQGRNRCDVTVEFGAPTGADYAFSFAINSRSEVKLEQAPAAYLAASPVFIPTREMLTVFPGFTAVYEERHLEYDETYYDLAKALSGSPRKKHAASTQRLIDELEQIMDGHIRLENGRFYLLPNQAGKGRIEIPLVAEGLRKLAMLAYLLINGSLPGRGLLFWDEPETNLNPKLIAAVARALFSLAGNGYQVILATHSLFLMREFEILRGQHSRKTPMRFIGLAPAGDSVTVEQDDDVTAIQTLVLLDEELAQSDRYLALD